MVEVKICGLTRREDAAVAEAAGARYGGVILAPNSARTMDPGRAVEVFGDGSLTRCGVFVNESESRVLALVERIGLGVVQLHGDESPDFAEAVSRQTEAEVWKAVRPRSADDFLSAAEAFAGTVDALLLDGWSAAAHGGTGARFPWREVAAHRARLGIGTRLVAAGGLTPENVGEVVSLLDPDIVDVSSGVEGSPGLKDDRLVRRFVEAATAAEAQKGVG